MIKHNQKGENDMELSVLTKSMLEIFKADDTSDFLNRVRMIR